MRCKAKVLHLLTTVALVVSLLLPGAEIFAPSVALAQSDPTPTGGSRNTSGSANTLPTSGLARITGGHSCAVYTNH